MLSMLIIFTNTNKLDENTFSEDICLLTVGCIGSWGSKSCREQSWKLKAE